MNTFTLLCHLSVPISSLFFIELFLETCVLNNCSTPIMILKKKESMSNVTPRSKKWLNHYNGITMAKSYKKMNNMLKCKLFRECKKKSCICSFSSWNCWLSTLASRKNQCVNCRVKTILVERSYFLFNTYLIFFSIEICF